MELKESGKDANTCSWSFLHLHAQAFYHLPFICARGSGFEMKG